jgi:hypothetical protein
MRSLRTIEDRYKQLLPIFPGAHSLVLDNLRVTNDRLYRDIMNHVKSRGRNSRNILERELLSASFNLGHVSIENYPLDRESFLLHTFVFWV